MSPKRKELPPIHKNLNIGDIFYYDNNGPEPVKIVGFTQKRVKTSPIGTTTIECDPSGGSCKINVNDQPNGKIYDIGKYNETYDELTISGKSYFRLKPKHYDDIFYYYY